MLATLAGFLALLLGLLLLLLPLLLTELSRPRDSAWGAVVLLLGLVLVTSAERLTGAPMLAVLCGGLLVGRLGGEVAQGRWRALSEEERQALRSAERWSRSLNQLAAVAASLVQTSLELATGVSAWLAERRQGRSHGKRWVRAETPAPAAVAASEAAPSQPEQAASEAAAPLGNPAAIAEPPESDAQGASVSAMAASAGSGDGPPAPALEPHPASGPEAPSVAAVQVAAAAAAEDLTAGGDPAAAVAPDRAPGDDSETRAAPVAILPQSEQNPGEPEPRPALNQSGTGGVRIVADFSGVDALLAAAADPGPPDAPGSAESASAAQPSPPDA